MPSLNRDGSRAPCHLSLSVKVIGLVFFIGAAMLACRTVWEETVWTWERGPQMVGFSLAHGPGAILFLFPVLLLVWLVLAVSLTIRDLLRREAVGAPRWIALALAVMPLIFLELSPGFWQRRFISRMASSPRSADLLEYAAATRDFSTVKAYVTHGVSVNAVDRGSHRTALHSAAVAGDVKTINFLISRGAKVNLLDRYGDSPLELAAAHGHDAAVKVLSDYGAVRIRGDQAQREKAIREMVHEETSRINE